MDLNPLVTLASFRICRPGCIILKAVAKRNGDTQDIADALNPTAPATRHIHPVDGRIVSAQAQHDVALAPTPH